MQFFTRAVFEPGPVVVIVLAAGWYVWGVRRWNVPDGRWPALRSVSFFAGLALIAASLLSGLPAMDRNSFSAYGAQYIMSDLVAPVLLALAAPFTLLVKTSPRLLDATEGRAGRLITHPFVTWLGFAASICVLFFSGLYNATLAHHWLQQLVLLAFAMVGWLFCWPVADVDPRPRRLAFWPRIMYLLLAFPLFSMVGMGLESSTSRIAPGVPLGDLQTGAGAVWVAGGTLVLLGVIAVFVQWLAADERAAEHRDRLTEEAAERQLALWRAAREAAARAASSS